MVGPSNGNSNNINDGNGAEMHKPAAAELTGVLRHNFAVSPVPDEQFKFGQGQDFRSYRASVAGIVGTLDVEDRALLAINTSHRDACLAALRALTPQDVASLAPDLREALAERLAEFVSRQADGSRAVPRGLDSGVFANHSEICVQALRLLPVTDNGRQILAESFFKSAGWLERQDESQLAAEREKLILSLAGAFPQYFGLREYTYNSTSRIGKRDFTWRSEQCSAEALTVLGDQLPVAFQKDEFLTKLVSELTRQVVRRRSASGGLRRSGSHTEWSAPAWNPPESSDT